MLFGNNITYQVGKNALDTNMLRQEMTAHNISNVNTENYKAKKVSFESELQKAMGLNGVSLKGTHNRHLNTAQQLSSIQGVAYETKDNTYMNLDGNNVDIELEMANMAANQIQYYALIQDISSELQMYQDVIKG